ncbi:MAG: type II toxin-antitoxin system RelE/ParE family toxin [Deltaproteobacteria bacterium]|jgi:plasmid stabilization system protein ParE|nr:type II toxin-antitoxin system RelE/ParE family toxin [Deltaproteobacteria bacterium]
MARTWEVIILGPADRDILEIVAYLAEYESLDIADKILNRIEETINGLSRFPDRGRIPPELEKQSHTFREIQIWPYRVIYEVELQQNRVSVHIVIDGRRNAQSVMEERLLRTSHF